jgi:hypothetical protein
MCALGVQPPDKQLSRLSCGVTRAACASFHRAHAALDLVARPLNCGVSRTSNGARSLAEVSRMVVIYVTVSDPVRHRNNSTTG